ncbi:MAG: chromosome partitioning protein ParB, chromosome partitioning protein ParB family [Candidatus Parcubacteria bacterium]|jgi:ParB family chromosome partitioning protein
MAFQGDSIYWVEVEKIVPNPFQPRREFDQHKLQELADSIRMYGVLQPLTVTRKEIQREDGTFFTEYELIAGERRLRASKLAGVSLVPVIIRDGEQSEQEKLELAIIENLQREDLNAVDRALAFEQLANMFGLSHAQVAQKMGRSREYVSNSIRLLGLPSHMLDALRLGKLSEGHARTLLMLNDRKEEQEVVFQEILLKKLSVREVERIARKIATDKIRKRNPDDFDVQLIEIEKRFTETLGTRVQIQKTDFGGKLTIDYFSTDDLEVILNRMKAEQQGVSFAPRAVVASEALSEATPLEISPVLPAEFLDVAPRSEMVEVSDTIPNFVTEVTTPVFHTVPTQHENTSLSVESLAAISEAVVVPEIPDEIAEEIPLEAEEDDSDLYSMHNFTV